MTLEDWDEISARLDKCLIQLGNLSDRTRLDCRRMSNHVQEIMRLADQERVICRRRRTVTTKYEQLIQQAQEALRNLEGHVIMATLMRKP